MRAAFGEASDTRRQFHRVVPFRSLTAVIPTITSPELPLQFEIRLLRVEHPFRIGPRKNLSICRSRGSEFIPQGS